MSKINEPFTPRYHDNDSLHRNPYGANENELSLAIIAYENVHEPVFHEWLKLDSTRRREAWRDRYVFYSCACCLGGYINERLKHDFEDTNRIVADVIADLAYLADGRVSFTEEWFKGIDRLVNDFTNLNFIAEARNLVALGLRTGVKKFPSIELSLAVHAAYLDALIGRRDKAVKYALKLVHSPYLLPSRRSLPDVYRRLMYILAASGRLKEYRFVLWTGVNLLQSSNAVRDQFTAQIANTYRGVMRALISTDVPIKYRFPFLLSNLARILSGIRYTALLRLDLPMRWLHYGLLFILDRWLFKKHELFRQLHRSDQAETPGHRRVYGLKRFFTKRPKNILVTRAMGGIGDILMMTPGLRALVSKYPHAQIDFAIPKSLHPVVTGLPGVRVLDIHEDHINLASYKRWINLTECPAGRVESRQAPNVRRNRIEIFARAMGISKWGLRRHASFLPFYKVYDDEREWARLRLADLNPDGKPVIGVQPFAADSYRNWPYMEQLVADLSQEYCVLVFNHEHFPGYMNDNTHKIIEPLRKSIALVSLCDKLIVLDSSLLHVSAALHKPTVAIFGAISGRLRTKDYPNVRLLAPSKRVFPCYPCWRHEHKSCHLTNGRESICLRSITVPDVIAALQLDTAVKKQSTFMQIIDWVRYGRE